MIMMKCCHLSFGKLMMERELIMTLELPRRCVVAVFRINATHQ